MDHDDGPLLAETAAPDLRPPPHGSPFWSRMTQPRKGPTWLRALLAIAIVTLAAYLLTVRTRRWHVHAMRKHWASSLQGRRYVHEDAACPIPDLLLT